MSEWGCETHNDVIVPLCFVLRPPFAFACFQRNPRGIDLACALVEVVSVEEKRASNKNPG